MSRLTDVAELISEKDEAIAKAINTLSTFIEECDGESETPKNCDGKYHYRGCKAVLGPILKKLRQAWELR